MLVEPLSGPVICDVLLVLPCGQLSRLGSLLGFPFLWGCRSTVLRLRASNVLRAPDGWSALMAAGQFGTAAMVKVLVLAKADLNLQMKNGWCAVIAAAQFGTTAMVQELVAAKANVNLQTENGWSVLMAAALGGNAEMVQDLIDGKADVNQQTHTGSTALMMTAVSGNVASARELMTNHCNQQERIRPVPRIYCGPLSVGFASACVARS